MKKLKKELIMEIAYNSFVDKGYENTNIRHICKIVHVEPPTIYYYFESKKGLFFTIAQNINERYIKLLEDQNFLERKINPEEKLFELFKFNLYYAKHNAKDIKFTLRYDLFPPEEISEELIAFKKMNFENRNRIVTEIFNECVRHGLIAGEQMDSVRKTYCMYVTKYCYYSVLFGHCPSCLELNKIWEYFIEYKLKS